MQEMHAFIDPGFQVGDPCNPRACMKQLAITAKADAESGRARERKMLNVSPYLCHVMMKDWSGVKRR